MAKTEFNVSKKMCTRIYIYRTIKIIYEHFHTLLITMKTGNFRLKLKAFICKNMKKVYIEILGCLKRFKQVL